MDRHELNRMFDQLAPTLEQEQDGLDRFLQTERKVSPVKKLKKWAVEGIAACAALVLCAYSIWRIASPKEVPLHAYTLMEGNAPMTAMGELEAYKKEPAPIGSIGHEDPNPDYVPDTPMDLNPTDDDPIWEAPDQAEALAQYDNLLRNMDGGSPEQRLLLQAAGEAGEPEDWPAWFAGAWLDNDWPDNVSRLTVAIVDDFRTSELEAQIEAWCGGTGDVLFCGAKYSQSYLASLADPAIQAVRDTGMPSSIGVEQMKNCLDVHIFNMSGDSVPDSVLAKLAELDPDGDAIRVQVFVGPLVTADELVKGPAE